MYRSVPIDAIQEIRTSLHSSIRVTEVLEAIAETTKRLLHAKGALVRTYDFEDDQFGQSAASGLSEKYLSNRLLSIPQAIVDLYELNKVAIIDDILNDPRVKHPEAAWEEGIRMMVDVPIPRRRQIMGIIRVYFTKKRSLKREELSSLVSCATCGACAIERARMMEAQRSQYDHLALQTEKLSSLGRMAAGIAHEINNPLAGILLYGTHLLKKTPKDGPMREGLEIIVNETQRCGQIIRELLEFSRESEPKKAMESINNVIEKALSILENEFRLRHVNIRKQLSDNIEETPVDINKIEQVLVNLLLNALEVSEEHGAITIRSLTSPDRKFAIVEIEDAGCGIPPENLERIFEPFFSTKANGTGLGLAVSYGIVQKHKGNIKVKSSVGNGTRFIVELPLFLEATAKGLKD
jgi:signal transduction histidine kinase